MPQTLVAVEVDFHDGFAIRTLRYFSGRDPLTATVAGSRVHYSPGLYVPLTFGVTINAETYGTAIRGAPNGGDVQFNVEAADYPTLAYGNHFQGHALRVYAGDVADGYAGLELQYSGRIADLRLPLDGVIRAQFSTTDFGLLLDDPIVSEKYPETETIEDLRGKPKPEVRGTVKGMAPVLLDNANQIYQVSRLPLVAVDAVRVGGIIWTPATTTIPKASQWSADLSAGTIRLGSPTLGAEVRVDARGSPVTTATLVQAIVTEAGGTVDPASMAALAAAAPYAIGWHTSTDPLNRLDALDQIMAAAGGWWLINEQGLCQAGVLASPSSTVDQTLTEVEINSMSLSGLIPPAWQIRVEHSRNWAPLSNVLPGATDAERQAAAATGVIAPAYINEAIKTAEPRAVDVPLIRALVLTEADALAIRARLEGAWGVARRVYDVQAYVDVPALYDSVGVAYRTLDSTYRVHSVLRSIGGGPAQMRLWGP